MYVCAHPAVVAELVAFLFALMGADEELEVVSSQHFLSDIWPPVAASASHLIGNAAVLGHWVTPQHVHYLGGQINHGEISILLTNQPHDCKYKVLKY